MNRVEIDCIKMLVLSAIPDGCRADNVARALLELAYDVSSVGLERAARNLECKKMPATAESERR